MALDGTPEYSEESPYSDRNAQSYNRIKITYNVLKYLIKARAFLKFCSIHEIPNAELEIKCPSVMKSYQYELKKKKFFAKIFLFGRAFSKTCCMMIKTIASR